jgi:hypothetical protein
LINNLYTHLHIHISTYLPTMSGRSSVGLERTAWDREVGGSNPLAPTIVDTVSCIMFNIKAFTKFF